MTPNYKISIRNKKNIIIKEIDVKNVLPQSEDFDEELKKLNLLKEDVIVKRITQFI